MAEPQPVDNGALSDYNVLVDEVTHGTLGTGDVQVVKLMDGTVNGTGLIGGDATNGLDVDVTRLPAGTVAGSASLPAGSNNIGDVDVLTLPSLPSGTNNIGDVDVLTLPNVTLAAGTNTNEVVGDAAHDAVAAGNPLLQGGYASAAAPADVSADGDAVRAWHLRNGAAATVLTAAGALIGGDATNGLDVDVTRLPALPAGSNNIGDVDVLTLPALPAGTNNIGDVDVLTLPALPAGNNNIGDVDIASGPTGASALQAQGAAASDAAVVGNPLLQGGRASTAVPTAVSADGDAVAAWLDRRGAAKVVMVDDAGDSIMDGTNDALRVNVVASSASGGDGAILDGVSSSIKATVLDYTNSNPVAVRLTDTSGDYVGAGAGTQYTEDVASAADPIGTQLIARRRDTPAAETSTDGDNVAVNATNKGELYVKHIDAIPVTDNGASLTVDGSVSITGAIPAGTNNIGDVDVLSLPALPTGTNNIGDVDVLTLPNVTLAAGTNTNEVVGDAAHDAAAAGNPLLQGGYASAAAPTDVSADGDAVRAWHLRNGAAATVITAAGALVGGDATNGLDVDVTRLPSIPAGTNNIGDVDVLTLPALPSGTNNIGDVDIASAPTGASAINVQGAAANDAAVAGNPVLMGGRASTDEPTAVSADGDAVSAWFDLTGRQVMLLGHADPEPPAIVNLTADGSVIAAPGASVSLYIKKGSIHNRAAAAQVVALEDGSGGTERWRAELAADGGGSLFDFGERGWKLTANTALFLDCVSGASPDIDVNITEYYIAP